MANTCGLFGDLVPNIYIDRVFLEESLVDTNNDGTIDLQTPTITAQLKVLDSISDGGTFSILGDALQFESSNGTVDLKKYFKVHCILFTSAEDADIFITDFERQKTGASYLIQTKDLNDFTNTYANKDGVIEISRPFFFDLSEGDTISYLRVFTFVELDTRTLEVDLGDAELPASYKNIISRYRDQVVIQDSQIVSQLTIFTTEDGDLWDDSFHLMSDGRYMTGRVHQGISSEQLLTKTSTTVNNVQDFRIRDEINAFVADFDITNNVQNTFPEQSDILNQALSKKTYFSQLFITKDAERNARYYFAFDYGAYVLENIKFSALVKSMSDSGKKKIIDNSKILNLIVSRTQVQNRPYRNHLGSPIQNRVASDGTIKTPLPGGSLGGENLNEISLILSEQPDTADSIIKHYTGLDQLMKDTEDGVFQYSVDVEINDGFVPVMREVLANLSNAIASYNNYVALANIPGVYDIQNRKFTSTPANPSSVIVNDVTLTTMTGQEIMESFGNDKLIDIINTYLDTLDLFVDIDTEVESFLFSTLRDALRFNISVNISPVTGSVDGIILFQNILDDLLGKINNILSVGGNSVGVAATTTNRQADSISSFKSTTIKTSEVFENTIDARFLNESYINNISAAFGTFSGLNIYTGDNLVNATETQVTPESAILNLQEQLADNNITFQAIPEQIATNVQETLNSTRYLGADSEGAISNLNTTNLSIADLEIVKFEDLVDPPNSALAAFDVQSPVRDTNTLSQTDLQTEVDVLVGFTVRGVVNVAQYQQTFTNTYMIKGAQFETKQLGQLTSPFGTSYYLCRQARQSDIEVVDTYFLVTPVSSTFDTDTEIVLTNPGQFLSTDVSETVLEQGTEVITNLTQEGVGPIFAEVDTEEAQQTQQFVSRNTLITRGY
jgi:hypothetical protein